MSNNANKRMASILIAAGETINDQAKVIEDMEKKHFDVAFLQSQLAFFQDKSEKLEKELDDMRKEFRDMQKLMMRNKEVLRSGEYLINANATSSKSETIIPGSGEHRLSNLEKEFGEIDILSRVG